MWFYEWICISFIAMCVTYEFCRILTFYMVKLQRLPIFHYVVCIRSMGSPSTSSSTTGSPVGSSLILSHKSHNTHLIIDLKVLKENKNSYKMTPNFLQQVINFKSTTTCWKRCFILQLPHIDMIFVTCSCNRVLSHKVFSSCGCLPVKYQ